jgi:GntR family transcriptional regulator, transcriptional repressor for pyruvate dehydrogenase complex
MNNMEIFRQVKKVRVSDSVVDQIISFIEEGTLKPGDFLPGERELVHSLGIARTSVREALRMLEYQGIIQVQSGKGAIIISDVKSADEEVVRRWFIEHSNEYLELIEVREGLEGLSAKLAAQRATQESIERIQQIIEDSKKSLDLEDVPKLVKLDHKFHQSVARTSGNDLLSRLIEMSVESLVGPRLSLFNIKERARTSWFQHCEIFNAIKTGDSIKAEKSMKEHMANVRMAIIELKRSNAV